MSSKKTMGVILGYANIIVKTIVNLLYTPMLLAFVGQGDYGVFQSANSFVFSLTLLSFGFNGAYIRFYTIRKAKNDEKAIRSLNGMYLILFLIISIVVIIIGYIIAANVEEIFSVSFTSNEVVLAKILMRIMTINIAVTMFSTVFDANVVVNEEFTFQQTRQITTTILTPILALILLFAGFETVGVAVAQLVVSVVLLLMNATYAINELGMKFDFDSIDTRLFASIATFSGWLFANQICDLVNQNVPNIVLGARCGSLVVAVFSVAIQLRNVFIALSTTLSNVFVPQVNMVVAESNSDTLLTNIMIRVGRYQMALLCWVYGGFIIVGRYFIERWAGKSFIDAYWMLIIMVGPLIVPLAQNIGIEIQKAKNLHKARSVVYLVMACLNVLFTALAAPYLGYWAAAIAYVGTIITGNCLFMNWYYYKRVGIDIMKYWKAVIPIIICTCIAVCPSLLGTSILSVDSWISFIIWGVIYTSIYLVMLYHIVLDKDEKHAALSKAINVITRGDSK